MMKSIRRVQGFNMSTRLGDFYGLGRRRDLVDFYVSHLRWL
jgi:hypothetical protein